VFKTEKYLLQRIKKTPIHLTLLDPEKSNPKKASEIAKSAESAGSAAIMIGGSTLISQHDLDEVIKTIKQKVKIPIILFPGNISGISKYADAIWFMSLLNSDNSYFITGAQALAAPVIKRYGLEPIPLGYIIVGEGGTAGIVGRAQVIPYNKPEVAALYALAAQYFGMRFVYLEAGSGVKEPVPAKMIKLVRKHLDIPLIVGGGLKTPSDVKRAVEAGANIVVTGTLVEKEPLIKEKLGEIIKTLKI
jgi:phosphoglycerol geranylgeranyltransferase